VDIVPQAHRRQADIPFVIDVYLVRHAIAEPRDAARWPDDSQRPLTADGIARFRRAAQGLRRIVPTVDRVLSSPYPRAWQTAVLLRDEAGWPAPEAADELAGDRDPGDSMPLLEGHGGSLALVGHEPHLSMLASLVLTGDAESVRTDLKKGGVVALAYESGATQLRWTVTPKILRALRG
jgi:phosphohistidine phosphatase